MEGSSLPGPVGPLHVRPPPFRVSRPLKIPAYRVRLCGNLSAINPVSLILMRGAPIFPRTSGSRGLF